MVVLGATFQFSTQFLALRSSGRMSSGSPGPGPSFSQMRPRESLVFAPPMLMRIGIGKRSAARTESPENTTSPHAQQTVLLLMETLMKSGTGAVNTLGTGGCDS